MSCETAPVRGLFQQGRFTLHSGEVSFFKIDCDALSDEDLRTLAMMLAQRLPPFGVVEGVPTGGLRLAEALKVYARPGPDRRGSFGAKELLIVDDVWTTGGSMEAHREGRDALGAVIFARNEPSAWVTPLFTLEAEAARWRLVVEGAEVLMLDALDRDPADPNALEMKHRLQLVGELPENSGVNSGVTSVPNEGTP